MTTLNPSIGHSAHRRQAASLTQTASWYLLRILRAFEVQGQRRAAPELARAARLLPAFLCPANCALYGRTQFSRRAGVGYLGNGFESRL